jgi:hypothetical protein
MCFNDGYIAYSIDGDQKSHRFTLKAGKLGSETVLPATSDGKHPELDQCNGWPRIEGRSDARIYDLRPDDGKIFVAKSDDPGLSINAKNQNNHVLLYRPGSSTPIELPILAKEMDFAAKLSYSQYAKRYVLIPHTWRSHDAPGRIDGWPSNISQPIYLISANGDVSTTEIPSGTWRASAAFPTQRGLFWISNETVHRESKSAGGWLLENGKAQKLFENLVDTAAVSPDGCKIVYQTNDFNKDTIDQLQLIDICQSIKEK